MSDGGFTLLWAKTLRSSLWVKESKETRLVWLTMLMLKDSDGMVQSSLAGLAHYARVSDEECEAAVAVLSSPDPGSTSKEEEGRRILSVPGGWRIVNSDLYRFSTEAKREFWRQQKEESRLNQNGAKPARRIKRTKIIGNGPTGKEIRFEKAGSVEEQDRIAAEDLPGDLV